MHGLLSSTLHDAELVAVLVDADILRANFVVSSRCMPHIGWDFFLHCRALHILIEGIGHRLKCFRAHIVIVYHRVTFAALLSNSATRKRFLERLLCICSLTGAICEFIRGGCLARATVASTRHNHPLAFLLIDLDVDGHAMGR